MSDALRGYVLDEWLLARIWRVNARDLRIAIGSSDVCGEQESRRSIGAGQVASLSKAASALRVPLPRFLGRCRPALGRAKSFDKNAVSSGWLRRGITAHEERQYFDALAAWKQAAKFDDQEALYRIGLLYARGEGVAQSFGDAVIWYKRAAEAGHIEAQFQLGVVYLAGRIFWTERSE